MIKFIRQLYIWFQCRPRFGKSSCELRVVKETVLGVSTEYLTFTQARQIV